MSVEFLHTETEPFEPGITNVAAVRREVFAGLASTRVFAEAAGRSDRTVDNWIKRGLPVVYFGRTPLIKVDAAREWLLSRRQAHPNMPRRGRLAVFNPTSAA